MDPSREPSLQAVLARLGVSPSDLLGHGGEASVWALDEQRVVRVLREGHDDRTIHGREALLHELRGQDSPFHLPEILDVGEVDGRWYAVERRLPGVPVMRLLSVLDGRERGTLIENHLEAAAKLGTLCLEPRGWFGDLIADVAIRTPTWREYLERRAATNLARSGLPNEPDPAQLARALPEVEAGAFVHLDAFAGNMLVEGTTITAVLDIGPTAVCGDPRLDPLAAAVYLSAPQITPATRPRDIEVAESWLRAAGLSKWLGPARRWLAAYWSFAVDDVQLHEWCRSVLRA